MEMQNTDRAGMSDGNSENQSSSFPYTRKYIVIGGVALFLVASVVAFFLCRSHISNIRHEMLEEQRVIEQAWADTAVENARAWQAKTLEQIHNVSRAEVFRLFAFDLNNLGEESKKAVTTAKVASDPSHPLYSMWEELSYLRDLLQDTANHRGWASASIVGLRGEALIVPEKAFLMTPGRSALIAKAAAGRATVFSAAYQEADKLLMDIAAPLYEVLNEGEARMVGCLLVSLPFDGIGGELVSLSKLKDTDFRAGLLMRSEKGFALLQDAEGRLAIADEPVVLAESGQQSFTLPFMRRASLMGGGEVWSLAGRMRAPDWYALIEKPASLVEGRIAAAAREVYAIGILASLLFAFLLAFVGGGAVMRRRAQEGRKCISGLVHAIECALDGRDPKFRYLQGRSHRLELLANLLGRTMKLSNESMETMRLAARLSQVGKIFVPREVMTKKGVLTVEERRLVQLAPYHAFNVLKGVLPKRVATTIYQMGGKVVDDPDTGANHELTLKEMSLEARVLLVANDFCAMISQRGNRLPLPMADARQKLTERAIYDPAVVSVLNTISDEEIRRTLGDDVAVAQV